MKSVSFEPKQIAIIVIFIIEYVLNDRKTLSRQRYRRLYNGMAYADEMFVCRKLISFISALVIDDHFIEQHFNI